MKKTVTINISGIIFHIEEDAYEKLNNYLTTIKQYFDRTEDNGKEVFADIEARIAEILQEKVNGSKQVIVIDDIDEVVAIMGSPKDFEAFYTQDEKAEPASQLGTEQKIKRRLFRNSDDIVIGGVCSGLAAYLDLDAIWVRLAMFLLVFFGGLSLWVYIILWIIIPQAKSTADKLAMKGEPATIDNIIKTVKEEANDLNQRINGKGILSNIIKTCSLILFWIFKFLRRIVGLIILLIGLGLFVGYMAVLFGVSVAENISDLKSWKGVIFDTNSDYVIAVLSFILIAGIPIFMLLFSGIKLLFKINFHNKWLNISAGLLWLIGLILGINITFSTLKQFGEISKIKEVKTLHAVNDTLYVKLNHFPDIIKKYDFENSDDMETSFNNGHRKYLFGNIENSQNIFGFTKLDVVESTNDSTEIMINYIARGKNKKDANANAKAIKCDVVYNNNQLIIDEVFKVINSSKFRMQSIDIKIKLPLSKIVFLDKDLKNTLNDIENTSNVWDGDMAGHFWKMTKQGLECLDCDTLKKQTK